MVVRCVLQEERDNKTGANPVGVRAGFVPGGCLDQTSLLEGSVGTVLSDGTQTLGRDLDGHGLTELRNEDTLLLEVWATTDLAARIELRCTRTVAVAATDLGLLAGYFTLLGHSNS